MPEQKPRSNEAEEGSRTSPGEGRGGGEDALKERLRQKLHDGLCQQLAGSALMQAALLSRLENLEKVARVGVVIGVEEISLGLQQAVVDARRVREALHEALEEARVLIRELG